jgi:hypothetical protein
MMSKIVRIYTESIDDIKMEGIQEQIWIGSLVNEATQNIKFLENDPALTHKYSMLMMIFFFC